MKSGQRNIDWWELGGFMEEVMVFGLRALDVSWALKGMIGFGCGGVVERWRQQEALLLERVGEGLSEV